MSRLLLSNFLNDASPEEQKLADDLLELRDSRASRVAAAVLREIRENFYHNAGLSITDEGTIKDLFCGEAPAQMPYQPPGDDHGRLVWFENKPIVYLSQPYGLARDGFKRITDFGDRWGLEVCINPAQALWYPGRSCAITYELPGATYDTPWGYLPG